MKVEAKWSDEAPNVHLLKLTMSIHAQTYKAGRAHRRPGTSFVDADAERGTLSFVGEDGRESCPILSRDLQISRTTFSQWLRCGLGGA